MINAVSASSLPSPTLPPPTAAPGGVNPPPPAEPPKAPLQPLNTSTSAVHQEKKPSQQAFNSFTPPNQVFPPPIPSTTVPPVKVETGSTLLTANQNSSSGGMLGKLRSGLHLSPTSSSDGGNSAQPNKPSPQSSGNKNKGVHVPLSAALGILVLILVLIGGGVAYYLSQQEQDLRQQASSGSEYVYQPPVNPPGETECNSQLPINTQFRAHSSSNADTPWVSGSEITVAKYKAGQRIDINCFAKNGSSLLSNGYVTVTLPSGQTYSLGNYPGTAAGEARNFPLPTAGTYSFSCKSTSLTDCADTDRFTVLAATVEAPGCNETCLTNADCTSSGQSCVTIGDAKVCRLTSNTSSETCTEAVTPTPIPTSTSNACDSPCSSDSQCQALNGAYVCYQQKCRLNTNVSDTTCYQAPAACNRPCSNDPECKALNSNYVCYNSTCRLATNVTDTTCYQSSSTTSSSTESSSGTGSTSSGQTPVSGHTENTILITLAGIFFVIGGKMFWSKRTQ